LFEKIKEHQKQKELEIDDSFVYFRGDDPIKRIEVFRLDSQPSSYEDFSLTKEYDLEDHRFAFIDRLEENKKYYYTFRAVDYHENVSNPTAVYEIELKYDSGATYMETKLYEFAPIIEKTREKTMRKYIQIMPTFEQSIIKSTTGPSWNSAKEAVSPSLGDVFDESRRFKIRFTSKSTGKKFDLNIKCEVEHKGLNG
jgi:hypothetical protein